ncbi:MULTISPECIES: hypothetical protein [Corynebacterium]|uniref:hypothetical protein n=1 Tax=Corynebacterium TaxID=1716 RepID=UPI00124C067A|nr:MULTISPECIES: hypothetical protein [Corynebacterium]
MKRFTKFAAMTVLGGSMILAPAAAQAGTLEDALQPTLPGFNVAGALPQWDVENGHAHAKADDAIALGISVLNGSATAHASNFSGPAAIAVGEGAVVEAHGVQPGLAIGIAGPDTMVTIDGTTPVVCDGQAGFAGDFQTLTGCAAYPNIDGSTQVIHFNDGTATTPLTLR